MDTHLIHLNACIACNTNNPSLPGQMPTKCGGCGRPLEVVRQLAHETSFWGRADGQSDDRWRWRKKRTGRG